jgi:hypothetical protein
MAAIGQKAELDQACLSVLFCSGFGQKQTVACYDGGSQELTHCGQSFGDRINEITLD